MKRFFGCFIFIITLAIYAETSCPTVYVGDGGELISAAYLMGIPHSPGYPLFCILGQLFTWLPLGSIAFRVNLVAAFFAALAILLLFNLLKKILSGSNLFALIFAALFAFTEAFWSQATHAKGALYILNVFFLALISWILVIWYYKRKNNYIYLASFFFGLALTNHYTALAFFPGFFLFIFFSDRTRFKDIKLITVSLFLFLSGLLVYFYLPIRAAEYPLMNSNNPADLKGMLDHILRLQYGSLSKNSETFRLFFSQALTIFSQLNKQFTVLIILLASFGIYYCKQKLKPLFYLSLTVFLFVIAGIVIVINTEMTPVSFAVNNLFFIPAYFMLLIWAFFGIHMFKDRFKSRSASFIALMIVLLFVSFFLKLNFKKNDKSGNYLAYSYGVNTLRSCETGGIIFANEDTPLYQLAYLQFVEKARPDVIVCDENGMAYRTLLTTHDKGIVYKNFLNQRVELYLESVLRTNSPIYHTIESGIFSYKRFTKVPSGILYRVLRANEAGKGDGRIFSFKDTEKPDGVNYDIFNRDMLARYRIFKADYLFYIAKKEEAILELVSADSLSYDMDWVQHEIGTVYARYGYSKEYLLQMEKALALHLTSFERRNNLGNAYMGAGRLDEAVKEFDAATRNAPEIAGPFHNKGMALNALGRREEAKKSFEKAAMLGQAESWQALLGMYLQDNELDNANMLLKKMMRANPQNIDFYVNVGVAYEKQGKTAEAEKIYRDVLAVKPEASHARINLGNIYMSKGQAKEAAGEYETAIKCSPGFVDAYYNLGIAYLKLNRFDEAKHSWQKVLELNPGHAGAKEALIYIRVLSTAH